MSKRTELRGEMRQVPKQRVRCESTLRLELETRTRNVEWLRSVAFARRVINARPVVLNLFFMGPPTYTCGNLSPPLPLAFIYIYIIYIYVQVHLNKLECRGKVHLFL